MYINYLKNIGYILLSIIIINIIITILNYFYIINSNIIKIISIIIMPILLFILGLLTSRKASKKGYLEGIKIGSIFTILIILINLILKNKITLYNILFYLLFIIFSMIGGMVGISKRKI